MKIESAAFTVLDFETTGLYPYTGDRICEIGAIRADAGYKRLRKFHSLVDPQRMISPAAFSVNGITNEMVREKPTIDEILPDFMRFIEGSVLVAYNAGFDLGFLESALGRKSGILADYRVIDALTLARKLFPGIGRYSLASVVKSLGFNADGEHRALADALMTWNVFKVQLGILKSKGILTIEDIECVAPRKNPAALPARNSTFDLVEAAIRRQKKLTIVYRSSWNNKITRRTITPRRIHPGFDRAYVIATCHLRNEERNFRIDCIVKAEECP